MSSVPTAGNSGWRTSSRAGQDFNEFESTSGWDGFSRSFESITARLNESGKSLTSSTESNANDVHFLIGSSGEQSCVFKPYPREAKITELAQDILGHADLHGVIPRSMMGSVPSVTSKWDEGVIYHRATTENGALVAVPMNVAVSVEELRREDVWDLSGYFVQQDGKWFFGAHLSDEVLETLAKEMTADSRVFRIAYLDNDLLSSDGEVFEPCGNSEADGWNDDAQTELEPYFPQDVDLRKTNDSVDLTGWGAISGQTTGDMMFPFSESEELADDVSLSDDASEASFEDAPSDEPHILVVLDGCTYLVPESSRVLAAERDGEIFVSRPEYPDYRMEPIDPRNLNSGYSIVGRNVKGLVQEIVPNIFTGYSDPLDIVDSHMKEDKEQFYSQIDFDAFVRAFLAALLLGTRDAKASKLWESNVLFQTEKLEGESLTRARFIPKLIDFGEIFSTPDDEPVDLRLGLMGYAHARRDLDEVDRRFVLDHIEQILRARPKIMERLKRALDKGVLDQKQVQARSACLNALEGFVQDKGLSAWTLQDIACAMYPKYGRRWKVMTARSGLSQEECAELLGLWDDCKLQRYLP